MSRPAIPFMAKPARSPGQEVGKLRACSNHFHFPTENIPNMLACFVACRRPIYRIFDGDWPLPAKYAVNMPNDSVGHRKLYGHQWSFCERQIHRLPAAISPTMCRSSAGHRPAYLKYASIPVASLAGGGIKNVVIGQKKLQRKRLKCQ